MLYPLFSFFLPFFFFSLSLSIFFFFSFLFSFYFFILNFRLCCLKILPRPYMCLLVLRIWGKNYAMSSLETQKIFRKTSFFRSFRSITVFVGADTNASVWECVYVISNRKFRVQETKHRTRAIRERGKRRKTKGDIEFQEHREKKIRFWVVGVEYFFILVIFERAYSNYFWK